MKVIIFICIALTAIGVSLPWVGVSVEVTGQNISSSIIGFQYLSYGMLVFLFSLITFILSFIRIVKKYRIFSMILVLIFSIIPFFHHPESMSFSSEGGSLSVGFLWGFYFTLGFAIISVILLFLNDYILSKKTGENCLVNTDQKKMVSNAESTNQQPSQSLQSKIVCPKCNTANPVNTKFCSNCGSALELPKPPEQNQECSNCKTKYPADARFCPQCGAPAKKGIDLSDL